MTVAVEGDVDARVAEHVLHVLRVRTPAQEQSRRRVAQIMKPYVRQARALQERLEMALDDVLGFDRRADGGRENEVGVGVGVGPDPFL